MVSTLGIQVPLGTPVKGVLERASGTLDHQRWEREGNAASRSFPIGIRKFKGVYARACTVSVYARDGPAGGGNHVATRTWDVTLRTESVGVNKGRRIVEDVYVRARLWRSTPWLIVREPPDGCLIPPRTRVI